MHISSASALAGSSRTRKPASAQPKNFSDDHEKGDGIESTGNFPLMVVPILLRTVWGCTGE
jgi:hypothetical protein